MIRESQGSRLVRQKIRASPKQCRDSTDLLLAEILGMALDSNCLYSRVNRASVLKQAEADVVDPVVEGRVKPVFIKRSEEGMGGARSTQILLAVDRTAGPQVSEALGLCGDQLPQFVVRVCRNILTMSYHLILS